MEKSGEHEKEQLNRNELEMRSVNETFKKFGVFGEVRERKEQNLSSFSKKVLILFDITFINKLKHYLVPQKKKSVSTLVSLSINKNR